LMRGHFISLCLHGLHPVKTFPPIPLRSSDYIASFSKLIVNH
jgi:hypothetical protein